MTVIGKSRDGPSAYTSQVTLLKTSVSSGAFTSLLLSTASGKSTNLLSVTKNEISTVTSAVYTTLTEQFSPSSTPTSAPTKLAIPTSSPTSVPTKYVPPTSHPSSQPSCQPTSVPTSYPTLAIELPQVSSIVISSSKTSIDLTVSLTAKRLYASGFLFCLSSSSSSFSSYSLLESYGVVGSFRNFTEKVSLTLTGLIPSKSYYVYCAIKTSEGYESPSSKILQSRTIATTSCCRSISFTKVPGFVYGDLSRYSSDSVAIQFQFSISYIPEALLLVTPSLTSTSTADTAVSLITIIPSTITFSPNSSSSFSSFILSGDAYTSGTYTVSFSLFSSISSLKDAYDVSTATAVVISTFSPSPAPNMTAAIFSNDGSSVVVYFSSATDKAGITDEYFVCNRLFSISNADLTTCTFLTSATVSMTFDTVSDDNLVPGSMLTLLPNILKSECLSGDCKRNYNASTLSVSVKVPETPLYPTVVFRAPSEISYCNNLTVDISSSYGHGGRSWKSLTWSVQSSSGSSVDDLLSYLDLYGTDVYVPVEIPSSLFDSDTYTFTVGLTNFLGFESSLSSKVTISSKDNLPVLTVSGSKYLTMYSFDVLSVNVIASVSSCATSKSINYTTALYLNGISSDLKSTSSDPRYFILPAYSLSAGFTYSILFTATSMSASASESVSVIVERGLVHAIISGGSVRQSPVDKDLTIDASSSYDEDSSTSDLSYLWSCTISTSSSSLYGSSCSSAISSSLSQSSIIIGSSSLSTLLTYKFEVSVSTVDGRSSSASVFVQPSSSGGATVEISSTLDAINVDSKLSLSGSLSSSSSLFAYWSVYYSGSLVNITSTTSASSYFSLSSSLSNATFSIIYGTYSFTPGKSYTFRLTAYPVASKSLKTYSETTITINSVPTGGVIDVSPDSGYALTTLFRMSCSLWSSSNIPLSYIFSYQVSSIDLVLQSLSKLTSVTSTLSAGLSSLQYSVTIYNYAYDTLGSSSVISSSATVEPIEVNITEYLSTSISDSLDSGNVDELLQVMNTISSTMNIVNCTLASDTYCAKLNRYSCETVPNTCGNCYSGYSGIGSESNTKCYNATAESVGSTGSSCSSNNDCLYGSCVNNMCTVPDKSCPTSSGASCSGYGTCEFFDSSYSVTDSCSITNTNCIAKCVCYSGYSGSDCSNEPSDAISLDTIRKKLCSAILSVLDVTDKSESNLKVIVVLLYSSFDSSEIISVDSFNECSTALTLITEFAASYLESSSTTTMTILAETLSKFVEKSAEMSSDTSTSFVSTSLDDLTTGILNSMSDGESAVSIVSDYVQIYVAKPSDRFIFIIT